MLFLPKIMMDAINKGTEGTYDAYSATNGSLATGTEGTCYTTNNTKPSDTFD